MIIDHLRLMLVLDVPLLGDRDPVAVARAAVQGGATSIQLRWKGGADRDVVLFARRLRGSIAVPVLVNDRLDIALAAGCAGAHLGAGDLAIALARRAAPDGFLIGASVGDAAEAAASAGADYVGIGPWRATSTKTDAGPGLGGEGVRRLRAMVGLPAVVIGGVRSEDVSEIMKLGAAGVAVAGGILDGNDVEKAARTFSDRLMA